MLEHLPELAAARRAASARRQRDYRRRKLNGELVYRVTIIPQVVEGLIDTERLSDAESHDRRLVERQLSALLNEWSRK